MARADVWAVALLQAREGRGKRALALYNIAEDGAAMREMLCDLWFYNLLYWVERDILASLRRLERWDVAPEIMQSGRTTVFLVMRRQCNAPRVCFTTAYPFFNPPSQNRTRHQNFC
jgi:hypothetical protein